MNLNYNPWKIKFSSSSSLSLLLLLLLLSLTHSHPSVSPAASPPPPLSPPRAPSHPSLQPLDPLPFSTPTLPLHHPPCHGDTSVSPGSDQAELNKARSFQSPLPRLNRHRLEHRLGNFKLFQTSGPLDHLAGTQL